MSVKCQLCGEYVMDATSLTLHMGKIHQLYFNDVTDMKRRLAAVGIDVEESHTSNQNLQSLHG